MAALPHHANPDEVANLAADWDDDMIECRLDRHTWTRLNAGFDHKEGTWFRVRRCPRCHTDEHVLRSLRTGEKLRKWLDYSNTKEGYLLPKGTGRMTSSATNTVWLELFKRTDRPARKVAASNGAAKKSARKRRS